jgi:hypothetical protein
MFLSGGPTPKLPAPASLSTQDSYVSKGGPLGGYGDSETVKLSWTKFLGASSYTNSVISTARTSNTLKSPGIPTLPRWTFEGARSPAR